MNIIGSVYIIIAGSYNSNSNLNRFINTGGLYNINKFYSNGVFGYNSSKKG